MWFPETEHLCDQLNPGSITLQASTVMPFVDLMQRIRHSLFHPFGFQVQRVGYLTAGGNRADVQLRPETEIKRPVMVNIMYSQIAYSRHQQ